MARKPSKTIPARSEAGAALTHIGESGEARMVDVSDKPASAREAVAAAQVRMSREAFAAITSGTLPKGDVLQVARIAGIQAAKRTSELIPMCHPLPLTLIEVECEPDGALPGVRVSSRVRCVAQTGAEMEALTAASVAALTIVDMAKSADRWMTIEAVGLISKAGGKSGSLRRPQP
jgi:cyclic pyranopterin phosphate synthase